MKTKYDYDKAKADWRELNKNEPDTIPLYMKDWYWDATCESDEEWKVICIYKDGRVEAAFPFKYTKRKGMWFIELPWQVASAGIWLRNTDILNKAKALNYLNDIVGEIVSKLPKYDRFSVIFNHMLWTWHPFYWLEFEAVPQYTSIIRKSVFNSDVKGYISKSRKKRVSRAEETLEIRVDEISPEEYWGFFEKSYEERGRLIHIEKERFIRLISNLKDRNACEIRTIYNKDNMIVAENILFMDKERMYDQFGTQLKNDYYDAKSFAIYDGISSCLESGRIFDFEGSMIKGVCEFNSSWNPE